MKKTLSFCPGFLFLMFLFLNAQSVHAAFFLHGSGPDANPPTLFLDTANPTAAIPKYKDSTGVHFSGGNPWGEIGTWTGATMGTLTEVNSLHIWLGLQNSDDVGTRFDLRAEIYKNGTLPIAEGESYCINGIMRNPDLAKEVVLSFGSFPPVHFHGSDTPFASNLHKDRNQRGWSFLRRPRGRSRAAPLFRFDQSTFDVRCHPDKLASRG